MLLMILKMSAVTIMNVGLTVLVWKKIKSRTDTNDISISVGVIYGIVAILATHLGIDYGTMLLNIRDLAPMIAGLFFDPVSGIVAGIIGGVERYIAGTYMGVGVYTTTACSLSTCIAGFFAAFLNIYIFKGERPSTAYALFMGAAIEVFHMYVVFVTHNGDMEMAYYVVKSCSIPMIIFSGLGLAMTSDVIRGIEGEDFIPIKRKTKDQVSVSQRFQTWLFCVTAAVLLISFVFSYAMESQAAIQEAENDLKTVAADVSEAYNMVSAHGGDPTMLMFHVGTKGTFWVIDNEGNVLAGTQYEKYYNSDIKGLIDSHNVNEFFTAEIFSEESLCLMRKPNQNTTLLAQIPFTEVYASCDAMAYETLLADILVFTVIYVLVSLLVQNLVIDDLVLVNRSLAKITDGDLEEKVNVYNSFEFASLSNDINQTVTALKGYIAAAENRIEQELLLAHTIQDSALPKNFTFVHKGFEIFATMDPAKEVGGDFYDFFFVDTDKLAMVIADVSGKGIPAALFMMRSKTAIRSLAEGGNDIKDVFERVNNELCEGNEISMFVTVWMGIIDLKNGTMKCVNAGHEYPAVMHSGIGYEILKDKHYPPLGTMEDMTFSEYELQLKPGECLYLYTDGVPEALNSDEEQYGKERMLDALNANRYVSMTELLPAVKRDMDGFVDGAEQFDDITMVGFRYLGMQLN